jgi:hypothetical protein
MKVGATLQKEIGTFGCMLVDGERFTSPVADFSVPMLMKNVQPAAASVSYFDCSLSR